ncbi:DsbA family oxidoreductase [Halorientalis halophila]|uniref:DsbA family oxidoreductase n=1 Tax=Halorientalis halophila TaxID=3108499 RepID=UPI00300B7A82
MSDATDPERITVFSDYVCPFCYLGRHSLAQYQDGRDAELAIDWHPYDLRAGKRNPDGSIDHDVDDGKDEDYYEQARENVRRLQDEYDVEMDLELSRDIDSLNAQLASVRVREEYDYEQWLEFDWAIFEALWTEGRDIGDPDVLADLADETGIDPELVRDAVADDDLRERVRELFDEAREQGITGVPTFAYDGYAARGAVPPEQLRRLVEGV